MLANNVATLLRSQPGATRDVFVDDPEPMFGSDLVVRAPVRGVVHLMRTSEDIAARGDLGTSIEVECSRCLNPFTTEVAIHFEEVYRPTVDVLSGTPLRPAEDESLQISDRHVLDLTETARQYFLTAVPLQPVCKPECRGLCPTCGADLNSDLCSCEKALSNSPFAALQALLSENDTAHQPSSR
jgi:uncharacterized protein